MAITLRCDKCGNELQKFGGILLSPPDNKDMVKKFHICVTCYDEIESTLAPETSES